MLDERTAASMLDDRTAAAISAALLLASSIVALVVWASLRAHARAEAEALREETEHWASLWANAKAEAQREEAGHDEDLPASPRCPRCGSLLCGHFEGNEA